MLSGVDSFYVQFGQRLREVREGAGLSQTELAHQVGLSRGSIANIEVGRQRPPLHFLVLLARELEVRPADLLPKAEAVGGPETLVPDDRLARLRPEDRAAVLKVVQRARERRGDRHG
jgi:transcriptional regulator with XRE-family HTH domain